jgi:ergothioneine biosynthesis protein EgtB
MTPSALQDRYRRIRQQTLALADPLSDEDCCAQSMPDASPAKWHLAHTTWFFETFVLERYEPNFRPFHPVFSGLFNSYYNSVGGNEDRHPRGQRGLLTRPSRSGIEDYRRQVDARMLRLLEEAGRDVGMLVEWGLQHEQQHQELLLSDMKHLLSCNPMRPASGLAVESPDTVKQDATWIEIAGGLSGLGHAGAGFAFDNELPRHRVFLEPYALASRLVTNGEYLDFIEDGGYRQPAHWLSSGWDWLQENGIAHPLYWRHIQGAWQEFTLHGEKTLDPAQPVMHLSCFEADAYARWAGARLPTEAEWEHAANTAATALVQLLGTAWQWTSSSYAPYPG